jgi:hypothetical protein
MVSRALDIAGSGRMTLLQAWYWRHRRGDGACMVDGVTDSGRGRSWHVWASTVVGNDSAEASERTQQ